MPAVNAPTPGGLNWVQIRKLIHGLVNKGRVLGMDLVGDFACFRKWQYEPGACRAANLQCYWCSGSSRVLRLMGLARSLS